MKPLTELSPLFDPFTLCQHGGDYQGVIAVTEFPRFCEALAEPMGDVQVTLHCRRDDQQRPLMTIQVSAEVQLICQRCNEPFIALLAGESDLCVLQAESQANDMPAACEPLVATDGQVDLHQMVEEELLLALPMIAKHENNQCLKDLSEFIQD